ncbi:heterokaryon incompatibility protein-domain-containing protein, partial [Phyllosticta capitalensis]
LKSWLSECDAEHSACGTGDVIINQAYPKRLVQVAGGIVRLVELPWDSTETYMTLSHCWGSKSDDVLRTLSTNITSMRQSIDWDEIPPTFQDAIRITRLMQCDFIWIDSLCIIQDDKSDWEDHAAQMAGIYSNSYLNIAATASKNPFQGFLSARTWTANLPHEADTRPLKSYSLSCNVVARPHLHQAHQAFFSSDERKLDLLQHDHVPLLRRAWVFQERMLSRRTLHFTGSEMIWECRDRTLCECGDYNVWPETGNFKNYFAQEISESTFPGDLGALFVWEACVQEFTSLDISDPSDWPQAFAGLATRFAPHLQSNYVAGLWEREFAVCLTWF